MRGFLHIIGWLACVVYSTIPLFWLMIHPFAERWRAQKRSPYRLLVPLWMAMWAMMAALTLPFLNASFYRAAWSWIPAGILFSLGIFIYSQAARNFSAQQLSGLPELHDSNREQRLATEGIRARVRHPIYLAHLCEMLAWSVGTGLAVCWGLTAFAVIAGAAMVKMEDDELEKRFGEAYHAYRNSVPAVFPRVS